MDSIANWLNDNLGTVAFFLPLFIGFIAHSKASEKVKAVVMLFVTLVATLIAQKNSGGLVTADSLQEWGKTVVITVASYYGVWKPLGAGSILPTKGIGNPGDYEL